MNIINGLPAHALLVHFVVVLVPLTALLEIVCGLWPAARRGHLLWLTLLFAVATMVLTPITINAGGWLIGLRPKPSPILVEHADRGSLMTYFAAALLAVAVGLVVLRMIERRSGTRHAVISIAAAILVLAVGISSIIQIYRVGDAGAQSVWGGEIARLEKAPAAVSSPSSHAATSTPVPAPTPALLSDYTRLLIAASDLNAPEAFTATPPLNNPNGQPGATVTFSNQDRTHVITDSIQVLPDPAAALKALESAKAAPDGYVHGVPEPTAIGTGGATISGPSPDGTKGVTVLLFAEGKAFVEVEFDGPPDAPAPPDFVTDVGQKQDAAVKKGLAG
jgi:hypothetical protein